MMTSQKVKKEQVKRSDSWVEKDNEVRKKGTKRISIAYHSKVGKGRTAALLLC